MLTCWDCLVIKFQKTRIWLCKFLAGLNPEQAGKYFAAVNDVLVKGCGAKTLTVDYETDVREGYSDRFRCLYISQAKKQHKIYMKVIIKILFL